MSQAELGLKVEESKYQKKTREAFGDWWYEKLAKVINGDLKNIVFPRVVKAYKEGKVYPDKKNLFRAYKETPNPRVLILGQSPYHDKPGQATGRAFECGKNLSYSLDVMLNRAGVNSNVDPFEPVLLDSWVKQGVMLLNSRLSIKHGNANSHKSIGWKLLIRNTVRALDKPGMVFVFYGSEARDMRREVKSADCFIYEDIHPAALAYNEKLEFNGGFKELNNYLAKRGESIIDFTL